MSEYGKSDSDRITVEDIVEGVQEDMCGYCCKYYAPSDARNQAAKTRKESSWP